VLSRGVHPYPSRRSQSTKAKWPSPLCSSSSPPHETHHGTTRQGAPRHAHHPGAAAPASKLHPEPSSTSTPPVAISNHRRTTGAEGGQLADPKQESTTRSTPAWRRQPRPAPCWQEHHPKWAAAPPPPGPAAATLHQATLPRGRSAHMHSEPLPRPIRCSSLHGHGHRASPRSKRLSRPLA
jgi:hypothetical protein